MPAFTIGLAPVVVLSVLNVVALGAPLPVNPFLVLLAVLGGSLVFAGLALVTALITKNSEGTQITSLPIVVVSMFGAGCTVPGTLPDWTDTLLRFTPLAPSYELIRLGWGGLTHDGAAVGFTTSFGHAWQPALTPCWSGSSSPGGSRGSTSGGNPGGD